MNKNSPLKMTPFDLAVTDNHLLTLKLLLPYAPSEFQSMLGIYVKFSEFQNTISYFHQIQSLNLRPASSEIFHLDSIVEDLKSYYPNEDLETLESIVQAMHMMEMMQNLNMDDWMASSNISDVFQTFHQERKEDNGNMDESSCNG